MAIALTCLGWPALAGDAIIARFETATGFLEITAADVAEAAPLSGEQGAGLAFELSREAGAAFADLTDRATGDLLTVSVCDEVLARAVVQGRLSGRGQVQVESLAEASRFARVLNGEISC